MRGAEATVQRPPRCPARGCNAVARPLAREISTFAPFLAPAQVSVLEDRPSPGFLLDVASVLSGLNHDIEQAEIATQARRVCVFLGCRTICCSKQADTLRPEGQGPGWWSWRCGWVGD